MTLQRNAGAVRWLAKAMRFAGRLQNLPNAMTPAPFRVMQISSAFWQSRALYVAACLDVAGVLADAAVPVPALAERVAADPDALARLLRMLAALGVFEETAPGIFRNNTLSAVLRDDHPQSVRPMVLMHNSEAMSRPWFEQLENGVRRGQPPFELSHGAELYDWMAAQPDFEAQFARAMDCVEALTGDSFVTDFDWRRCTRVIDLGGSRGAKALAILRHHPGLTAVVVDRAPVVAAARRHWADHPVPGSERLAFQAGDLFAAVPPARDAGDVYLLAAVLHGYDDARCARILANVATAVADSGAHVAVLEMVLPETGADLAGASFDMQMFMATRGRERTLPEWRALCADGGLALAEVVGLRPFGNILVLRRA